MTQLKLPRFSRSQKQARWTRLGLFIVLSLLLTVFPLATASADGHTETIVQFSIDGGELSEGVTVDSNGNIFVILSPIGQLVKIAPGSDVAEPFGSVSGLEEGDIGLLGLTVDADDNVYGGVFSANPDANGVWKFDRETGEAERVPGTEAIELPNSVVFDDAGTLYVTDTIGGAVWRVPDGGSAEPWIADPLLAGDGSAGFPFPLGANGIDVRDDTIYIGNTEPASIVTVPILEDGSAGEATLYADVGTAVDGIVLDEHGNVYVAAVIDNTVVRVNTDGTIDTIADADDGLDAPASVALGAGEDGQQTLYASNFSVAVAPPGGAGPGLVKIAIDPDHEMMAEGEMAEGEHAEGEMTAEEPATLPATGNQLSSLPASLTVTALTLLLFAGAVFVGRRRQM